LLFDAGGILSEIGRVAILSTGFLANAMLSMAIAVLIPVVLGFPAMFFAVPPLVILIPAALAFGIQVAAAVIGFAAALAVVLDGAIESRLSLLDGMLTLSPVVGVRRGRGDKRYER